MLLLKLKIFLHVWIYFLQYCYQYVNVQRGIMFDFIFKSLWLYVRDETSEGCLCSRLCIWNHRTRQVIFFSFVSASFPLLLLLCFFQRWCRDTFLLLLLQAAQRIRIVLFPLPFPSLPLPILLVYSLLLFQAADLLLLTWADQLSHLDSLDVVKGFLGSFVQHNGVENDIKQRNTRNIL